MPSRSESPPASDWLPTIVKWVALPIAGVAIIYIVITQLLLGKSKIFADLYEKQYTIYVDKVERYSKESNGAFTAAQIASMNDERQAMQGTLANIGAEYNGFIVIGQIILAVMGVVALARFSRPLWEKYLPKAREAKTAQGATRIAECLLVDQLAFEGMNILASNMLTSIVNQWNTVDSANIQTQVNQLQQQINAGVLTGIELLTAQYMVSSLTYELQLIPTVFALPLV